MNTITHDDRTALLPHLGLPVSAEGAVARWGTAPLGPSEHIHTLMLRDIRINGRPVDVDHLWFRLGRTGSARLKPHLHNVTAMRCSLNAVVLPYPREDGRMALGLARASEVYLHGQRVHLLNRRAEVVHSDEYARAEQNELDRLTLERTYAAQAGVMTRLAEAAPRSRHLNDALQRYFVRRSPVTTGQLRAAAQHLRGAAC